MAEQKAAPAKAPAKKKQASGISRLYETNPLKRKNKFCPKCGPGFFMAKHKNRCVCGKCGYAEMI